MVTSGKTLFISVFCHNYEQSQKIKKSVGYRPFLSPQMRRNDSSFYPINYVKCDFD